MADTHFEYKTISTDEAKELVANGQLKVEDCIDISTINEKVSVKFYSTTRPKVNKLNSLNNEK